MQIVVFPMRRLKCVFVLPAGYNVPTANYPNAMLKVLGLVNKNIKAVIPQCGKVTKFDNTKVCSIRSLSTILYTRVVFFKMYTRSVNHSFL